MDSIFDEIKKETMETRDELASETEEIKRHFQNSGNAFFENTKSSAQEIVSTSDDIVKNIQDASDQLFENSKKTSVEIVTSIDELGEGIIDIGYITNQDDGYVKKKTDMIFQSGESLQQVVNVVNEAAMAINDENRTIRESSIPEVLAGALGAGVGGVGSFAALYGLGVVGLSAPGITSALAAAGAIVGGGMVAGIFVLAAPIAALSAGSVALASKAKQKQLKQEKERLYKEALAKHEAIIKALQSESKENKDRMDYLQSLNILLQRAIEDLQKDLGIKAA